MAIRVGQLTLGSGHNDVGLVVKYFSLRHKGLLGSNGYA